MPRETINTPKFRALVEDPDHPGEWVKEWAEVNNPRHQKDHWRPTPVLAIGWGGAGINPSIQVTMEVDADDVLAAAEVIMRSRQEDRPPIDSSSFATLALDRREVQHLIATARRARNVVFGADE